MARRAASSARKAARTRGARGGAGCIKKSAAFSAFRGPGGVRGEPGSPSRAAGGKGLRVRDVPGGGGRHVPGPPMKDFRR